MKNIFDFLLTDQRSINDATFTSFADWMFPGSNNNQTLSKKFLKWSVLMIMNNTGDQKPTNLDFYSFFHGQDQSNPETFLAYVSEVPHIRVEVEKELREPEERTELTSEAIASAFLSFMGTVMEHVANQTLFPEASSAPKQASKVAPAAGETQDPFDKNTNLEFKKLSNSVYMLFVLFLAAFVLFNFFIR